MIVLRKKQRTRKGKEVIKKIIMKSNFVKFASKKLEVKIEGSDIIAIHKFKKRKMDLSHF